MFQPVSHSLLEYASGLKCSVTLASLTVSIARRQVSVYDTIDKEGGYSGKVRLLGEFHPSMATNIEPGGQDIDDPLYGNVGGAEEKVLPMRLPLPDCSLVQAVHALTWLASQYTSLLAVNLLQFLS